MSACHSGPLALLYCLPLAHAQHPEYPWYHFVQNDSYFSLEELCWSVHRLAYALVLMPNESGCMGTFIWIGYVPGLPRIKKKNVLDFFFLGYVVSHPCHLVMIKWFWSITQVYSKVLMKVLPGLTWAYQKSLEDIFKQCFPLYLLYNPREDLGLFMT